MGKGGLGGMHIDYWGGGYEKTQSIVYMEKRPFSLVDENELKEIKERIIRRQREEEKRFNAKQKQT
jgi:hypothetical protein